MSITLSHGIPISLMQDIMKNLAPYADRDLSHFYVNEEEFNLEICASFPGNGVFFPGVVATVLEYPSTARERAEQFAADLNTLFMTVVPT